MISKDQILVAFNFRHACKEFDPARKIPDEDFNFILETGRLSPSSHGLEPWRFLIVQNAELRAKMVPFCWGARKQLPTASHFVVILARSGKDMRYDSEVIAAFMRDVQKSSPEEQKARVARLQNFQQEDFKLLDDRMRFDWACEQTYIALGNMMTAAAEIGIDSCPIGGFNREKVETLLAQEGVLDREHFGVSCMVAFGYRRQPPARPKTRQALDTITEWIE